MANTPSTMLELGTIAPDFNLYNPLTNAMESLSNIKAEKATLVMFICNHCPFVIHINNELINLYNDFFPQGIAFVAISSNDPINYPDDAPDKMAIQAKTLGYQFPYLFDETQEIAKAYKAACTPDFFMFDKYLKLVYRGQLDDSRPGNNIPVSGIDIRKALDSILANKEINFNQKPSIGCNIKWKK